MALGINIAWLTDLSNGIATGVISETGAGGTDIIGCDIRAHKFLMVQPNTGIDDGDADTIACGAQCISRRGADHRQAARTIILGCFKCTRRRNRRGKRRRGRW